LGRRAFLQATSAAVVLGSIRVYAEDAPSLAAKDLKVHSVAPPNAEPTLDKLEGEWLTPTKHFYVRSHGKKNPTIDVDAYSLKIEGLVEKPLTLSLAELKGKFKDLEQIATLTCAGNRRNEHSAVKPVSGVQWELGAIGNANWKGPKLWDVLKAAGVKAEAKHVWFDGLDEIDHDGHTIHFGASIPLDKAAADSDKSPPALLAHTMNGAALTSDHGFPLRTVVPGYIGARSVKWLNKITVSDRPSPNHFVADVYKLLQEGSVQEAAGKEPIYENVINSAFSTPMTKTEVKAGRVRVAGFAIPSGKPGAQINKVEVSADGGKSWQAAELGEKSQVFCWRWWSLPLTLAVGKHTLLVRASDSAGVVQPQTVPWNAKGYLFNAWHKVEVEAA
jgi:sulfite oxidase